MKNRRQRLASLLLGSTLLAAAPSLAAPQQAPGLDLTVVVKDLRSDDGLIKVALWRNPTGFTDPEAAVARLTLVPDGKVVEAVFKGLPPGNYALASYHDENANGELDKTFIGWPDEGLGFSNGAWIKLGPPSFEEAAISLRPDTRTTVISLRY